MKKFFLGAQWDMFEMPGGLASSYFAIEQFEVNYDALVDAQSEAGLVGGSAGNSAQGNRSVTAFAAETIFPVTDWMEVDAASGTTNTQMLDPRLHHELVLRHKFLRFLL